MNTAPTRILVVDDNVRIHEDFAKVLSLAGNRKSLGAMELELFGESHEAAAVERYQLSAAASGRAGLELVRRGVFEGRPFAMAFVDMRMPDWDGVQTIEHLWKVQPHLEVAICSAYMDYSWHDVVQRLKKPGIRLVLKPWTTSQVLEAVQEMASRQERRKTEPRASTARG